MRLNNRKNYILKRETLIFNNENSKNCFNYPIDEKKKKVQRRNISDIMISRLFILYFLPLLCFLLLHICIFKGNMLSKLQISNEYSRNLSECVCFKCCSKTKSKSKNNIQDDEQTEIENLEEQDSKTDSEDVEKETNVDDNSYELKSEEKSEDVEKETNVDDDSYELKSEEKSEDVEKETNVDDDSYELKSEENSECEENEDKKDNEVEKSKKSSSCIPSLGKRGSELEEQLGEEEIFEKIKNLGAVPSNEDVFILWWQFRGFLRSMFLDLYTYLQDLYGMLMDKYKCDEKFLKKEWKKWYYGFLKDLASKETEDNKTFYATNKDSSWTPQTYEEYLKKNKEDWEEFTSKTRDKWEHILISDFSKKKQK